MQILKNLVGRRLEELEDDSEELRGLETQLKGAGLIPARHSSKEKLLSEAIKVQRRLAEIELPEELENVVTDIDIDLLNAPQCATSFIDPQLMPLGLRELSPRGSVEQGWNKSTLNVQFGTNFTTVGVTVGEAKAAIRAAMATWNAANVGVQFQEMSLGVPDILISWLFPIHDPEQFLVTGSKYAHGDFPAPNTLFGPPPLPICFSAVELWSVNGNAAAFDIESVALHELGHSLGLFHKSASSIMYRHISRGVIRRVIDAFTVSQARGLYT